MQFHFAPGKAEIADCEHVRAIPSALSYSFASSSSWVAEELEEAPYSQHRVPREAYPTGEQEEETETETETEAEAEAEAEEGQL